MRFTNSAVFAVLFALALGGCSKAPGDNQTEAENSLAESRSQSAAENVTANAGSVPGTATTEASSTSVSSGMPVPGSSTPEHVVVNEDAANGSANRL